MKLDKCNELAQYIVKLADEKAKEAVTHAQFYADKNNVEDRVKYLMSKQMEQEYRDLHGVVCSYLWKIEDQIYKQ
jgi:hypothetical protein